MRGERESALKQRGLATSNGFFCPIQVDHFAIVLFDVEAMGARTIHTSRPKIRESDSFPISKVLGIAS